MYLKLHCVSHLIPVCCATTECDSLESASITCNENKDNVSEPTPRGCISHTQRTRAAFPNITQQRAPDDEEYVGIG